MEDLSYFYLISGLKSSTSSLSSAKWLFKVLPRLNLLVLPRTNDFLGLWRINFNYADGSLLVSKSSLPVLTIYPDFILQVKEEQVFTDPTDAAFLLTWLRIKTFRRGVSAFFQQPIDVLKCCSQISSNSLYALSDFKNLQCPLIHNYNSVIDLVDRIHALCHQAYADSSFVIELLVDRDTNSITLNKVFFVTFKLFDVERAIEFGVFRNTQVLTEADFELVRKIAALTSKTKIITPVDKLYLTIKLSPITNPLESARLLSTLQ